VRPSRSTARTSAPGLVDLQVNGGGDVLLQRRADGEGVAAISAAHRRLGSTGVMPTLISAPRETIGAALEAVRAGAATGCRGSSACTSRARFLAPERAGIHDARQIRPMTGEDAECSPRSTLRRWSRSRPSASITACSSASSPATSTSRPATARPSRRPRRRRAAGLRLVTHLFNAMSGIGARPAGARGAALADDRVACGLIADGPPRLAAAIEIALRCKPPGGLFLVSDAMPPVGGSEQRFVIGGTRSPSATAAAWRRRRARGSRPRRWPTASATSSDSGSRSPPRCGWREHDPG
jgi:N-acetylglucosamine-6-phosphate deacetylase